MDQLVHCYSCGVTKNITEYHKLKSSKTGRQNKCKKCQSDWARTTRDPGKKKARWLHNEYGLSLCNYLVRWRDQAGKCGICRCLLAGKHTVDHNHDTGAVRGLLCVNCNTIVGAGRAQLAKLARAVLYIKQDGV